MAEKTSSVLDINGPNFDSNLYLEKLFKEATLKEIMDHENEVIRDIQTLHSDMQTLVYENYNKFISATDTIKKMKNDFSKMESEIDLLMSKMSTITTCSDKIDTTLNGTRDDIQKLSSVHQLLQRLQFLFQLPANLKLCIEEKRYTEAVHNYLHAERVLQQYGHLPSFKGIREECEQRVDELRTVLCAQFRNTEEASAQELADAVDLLLKLKAPAHQLCGEFLCCAGQRLDEQLILLKDQSDQRDWIEFIDLGATGFLSDLSLVVVSFHDMFMNRVQSRDNVVDKCGTSTVICDNLEVFEQFATGDLKTFCDDNMCKYFELIRTKMDGATAPNNENNTKILVEALNRFYRRVTTSTMYEGADYTMDALEIVTKAARKQCKHHLQMLKQHFSEALNKLKHTLTTPTVQYLFNADQDPTLGPPPTSTSNKTTTNNLNDVLQSLIGTTVEKIKAVLVDLVSFLSNDVTFASKSTFLDSFCVDQVREGLIVCFMHHLTAAARTFCTTTHQPTSIGADYTTILLILSKFCLEFRNNHVVHLLNETDKLFRINTRLYPASTLSTDTEINSNLQESAQELLNCYVKRQGFNVSQMLRKSVETRDWLRTIEPRTVRAVMKRVIEDIATIDSAICQLYDDQNNINTEHSSDSSRKTHSQLSMLRHQRVQQLRGTTPNTSNTGVRAPSSPPPSGNWSNYSSGTAGVVPYHHHLDSSTLFSNVHKIFSEKIEIFAPVEFSKPSILTGIIKISLKTLMECVRLKCFSRYGLQQIQVDTHYLQLYLWKFVPDENLVHFLLDEILGSAVHRCLEPVLMEPSVVDIICERM